ncbi:S8 family peptidase [Natronoglycomyces albus]|uniref:S8 family serine peptidase n=1 Tax=Natronoglycomyces albus TaxID=2811108 RepID=A0A895XRD5_9ACTN|nr:S8 family serine peptidase [Natronoglycomyces albus]QSB05126.1 S8 family serine peptidase [Natronoglycomyces albus]
MSQTARPRSRASRWGAAAIAATLGASAALFLGAAPAHADEVGGWALDALNVEEAWQHTQGEGITVAVLDTGLDASHPYFEDKNVHEGYSTFDSEDDAFHDQDGHGTLVSSLVLAVAPEATLMPVKTTHGRFDQFETVDLPPAPIDSEIRWAVDNGADVLVLPFGSNGIYDVDLEAYQYAVDNDVLVLAAAGNDPDADKFHPAATDGILAVSGTDVNGELYVDSTTGPHIDAAGPAADITAADTTIWQEDDHPLYRQFWGTSLTVGLIGGVAALVLASDSDIDANNAIARMLGTAVDIGPADQFGHGLIDAGAAVAAEGIDTVSENPLGYPMGESGASQEAEEEPTASPEAAGPVGAAPDDRILGLSPLVFWLLVGFIVLDIIAVTIFLVLKKRKEARQQPQAYAPWPQYPGQQGSSHPPQY